MITMRIKRRAATCCQLKRFAPVWSRFLAVKSFAVLGHDSVRVHRNPALAPAGTHEESAPKRGAVSATGRSAPNNGSFRRRWTCPNIEGSSGEIPPRGAATLFNRGFTALPVTGCRGRVEVDRLVVVLDRLFVPPQFGLGVAAAEEGRGMIGVKTDRPVVVGDGLLVAFQAGAGLCALEIEPGIVRVEADRLGTIGDGFFKRVQIGLIKTEAGPSCRAVTVVRREGIAEDWQPWRRQGTSAETAVGARPCAGSGFQRRDEETAGRLRRMALESSQIRGAGQAERGRSVELLPLRLSPRSRWRGIWRRTRARRPQSRCPERQGPRGWLPSAGRSAARARPAGRYGAR